MKKIPPRWLVRTMLKLGIKPPPPPQRELPENFGSLSPDEKYQYFINDWSSTDNKHFSSKNAALAYQRRTQRWADVIALKTPDRVPCFTMSEGFVVEDSGITYKDTFYNNEKTCTALIRFYQKFQPDYLEWVPGGAGSAFDRLELQLMRWPGSSLPEGLGDDTHFQYVEDEYMVADEYDQLIENPEGYFLRNFFPRAWKGLDGFKEMPTPFFMIGGISAPFFLMPFCIGQVSEALKNAQKAADETLNTMLPRMLTGMEITAKWGSPSLIGGFSAAPFDMIGDFLRGTKGIMFDMYRCPEKIVAACEAITPIMILMGVQSAMTSGIPFVFIPLHKGADSFMSKEQFKTFYLPTFKKLLMGLIDAGLVPLSFVEGSYNQRLDILAESGLPVGKTAWLFDQTDIQAAKDKFQGFACVGGNVPSSLFATGTPQEMEAHCKHLIDTVGSGGGYFLGPGAVINNAKPENMRAFINSARKFGVY